MSFLWRVKNFFIKIRRVVGFVFFAFLDHLAIRKSKSFNPKTLLLVRMDVLGDYILFRNFIEILRNNDSFKDYHITFVGNKSLKDIVVHLDKTFINNFIWIDREKFVLNPFYRFKLLRDISKNSYEIALNPQFSREFFHSDTIIKAVNAKIKIGYDSDLNNQDRWQKNISDKYYSKLIPAKEDVLFEFYRNKIFFESILNTSLDIKKPQIHIDDELSIENSDYIIICPGARVNFKQWSPKYFAEIATYLIEKHGTDIIIIGSKDEIEISNSLISHLDKKDKITNLTGKLSIVEVLKIVKSSRLVIVNDTGIAHISIALETPTLVISNGNHFSRFFPYPDEISKNLKVLLPSKLIELTNSPEVLKKKYKYLKYYSDFDINEISPADVKNAIDNMLDI